MSKKKKIISITVFIAIVSLLIVGIILTRGSYKETETIQEIMKDAVLHNACLLYTSLQKSKIHKKDRVKIWILKIN